jgi:hypothetical protein
MDHQDERPRDQSTEQGSRARRQGTQGSSGDVVAGYAVVDIWTFALPEDFGSIDLTGYSVEATDGGIGKVDEATGATGSSYLIVDTGPWIFGKKVMLPAGVVTRVDRDDKKVYVGRTKDGIKNAPEYDPEKGQKDREYRGRLGDYYGAGSTRR